MAPYQPDSYAYSYMEAARQVLQEEFTAHLLTPTRFAGEWVVSLASGLDPFQFAASVGGHLVSSQTHLIDNTFVIRFDAAAANPLMAGNLLDLQVSQQQMNWFYPLLGRQVTPRFLPNDPMFANQWHLQNTGQGGGTVGVDANVVGVWDTILGRNVQIAIIDDGLQWNHPDLAANGWINPGEIAGNGVDDDGNGFIDDIRGWDFNGDDNDPTPSGSHGTSVGGVAAGRGNNGVGISGAAPEAQLIGLKLIAGSFNDADEAQALGYLRNITDIFSNSWGPSDNGSVLDGPGPLALASMQATYQSGRNGLGGLITWAGGNGGNSDNSNYDGYANSRFALGVAALTNQGVRASYSELGANIFVAGHSNGGTRGITTTANPNTYTNSFGGTSSATPLVSGIIALMLEANPNLTARDVQYILAQSSRVVDAADADWVTNGGGYHHNHKYGFGAIDAGAAVALAQSWTTVAPQLSFSTGVISVNQAINDNQTLVQTFNVSQSHRLEHVEVVVTYAHPRRGQVELKLISPDGTVSHFARRPNDNNANLNSWKFMTVRNWGESAAGQWRLELTDLVAGQTGTWNSFSVNFFGVDANRAPLAGNDGPYGVNEDGVLNVSAALGVLANDTDGDADPLVAQLVTQATNGVVVLNTDGSFTYTPNANFNGNDSFTYRAFDGFATSSVATVSLTVNPVNDDPLAFADGYFVEAGTSLNVSAALGVLANDNDPDGSPLTAQLFGPAPANGAFSFNSNGSFTYTPNAGFTGVDSFQYRAFDGGSFSAPATVSLVVNARPVAVVDHFDVPWNQPFIVGTPGVLLNDQDADGDPLTAELVTTTTHGTLNFLSSGGFTYSPNANFIGVDSFTYRVRDPFFMGNTVTVTLGVFPPPLAGDDSYVTPFGQWFELGAPGILANDVYLSGGALTAELVSGPALGELEFSANGSFRYLPGNNYDVVDSFRYRVRTAGGLYSNVATVHLQITPPPGGTTAVDDHYSTAVGVALQVPAPGLLTNDILLLGPPIAVVVMSGPANGLLGLAGPGGFTYVPNVGFSGTDQFTYRLQQGNSFSNTATVTIQVTSTPAPPVGVADSFTTQRNSVLTVGGPGVLGNDSDPQGLPLTAQLVSGVTHGQLTLNPSGGFTYTPSAGYEGPDGFTYRASNGTSQSAVTTVNLTVTPPALPPTALADGYHTALGTPLVVNALLGVLANDVDPQGLPLTAQLAGPVLTEGGTLNLNPDGSFVFTPAAGFSGVAQFNYRASNGAQLSPLTPITITVAPGPGGPNQRIIVAPQSGLEPRVKVFDGVSGAEVTSFLAYEASFQGGVRVATGDVTGDGIADIITAPGAGRLPHVRVFDGVTFQQLAGTQGSFLAYSTSFTGGVFVAAGDVNGDGRADIITGPDAGTLGPNVRVFNGTTGTLFPTTTNLVGSFNAYANTYKGGVRVAAADLNGDGRADVITAPGTGTIASGQTGQVRSFDLSRKQPGTNNPFLLQKFNPYGTAFAGGVFVAAGDVDGDGRAEVITGSGAGQVGSVKIYAPNSTVPSRTFTPIAGYTGGVRVAAGDVNGDGLADLLVGTSPGVPSRVRGFDAITLAELFTPLVPFATNFQGGVNLAGRG